MRGAAKRAKLLKFLITNYLKSLIVLGTALLGEKAAMACTVAVETVIVEHYNEQLRQIMESPKPDKVIESIYYDKNAFFTFIMLSGTIGYNNKVP